MHNIKQTYHTIISQLHHGKYVLFANLLERTTFFVLMLFIARMFPKSEYGFIATIFAFANIVHAGIEFGFTFYFQREAAAKNTELQKQLSHALNFRFVLLLPFLLVIFLYFFVQDAYHPYLLFVIALSAFFFGVNVMLNAVLYGKQHYKTSFNLLFISRILLVMLFGCFYFLLGDLTTMMLAFPVAAIIHFALLFSYLKKTGIPIRIRFPDFRVIRKIFRSSVPMALGVLFVMTYDKIDIILIEGYLDLTAVAIYAVAYTVYKLPQLFSGVALTPLFSKMSAFYAEKEYLSRADIKKPLTILLMLSAGSLLFFSAVGAEFITLLYGYGYFESSYYLLYLAIGVPGILLNNMTGVLLNSCRYEKVAMYSALAGAVFNIVLNIILLPLYGLLGAVFATIATEYCILLIQYLFIINKKLVRYE